LIFEDAHWTDPTSLELFGLVVDRVATHPVLLIVTFRPEFDPPWMGQSHVTSIMINRLTHRDVGAMIDRVVGNNLLPANVAGCDHISVARVATRSTGEGGLVGSVLVVDHPALGAPLTGVFGVDKQYRDAAEPPFCLGGWHFGLITSSIQR
jgi:hypothetical protein